MQIWSDFLQIQAKNQCNNGWISQIKKYSNHGQTLKLQAQQSLKQWLHFSDKNGLQRWSDFLQSQTKKPLKQRLVFLAKTG